VPGLQGSRACHVFRKCVLSAPSKGPKSKIHDPKSMSVLIVGSTAWTDQNYRTRRIHGFSAAPQSIARV